MKRYSAFAIAREALRYHTGWERAWGNPEPKKRYDVVIVGAGGHGLATAFYLGKNFGITNVAVIEKGWLGGGNTGRNTTIIRSNYLQDPSAAIYEKSRSLYETMSQDVNMNVMFSPRGVIMLAQTHHEVRGYERTAHANALQGVDTTFIGPEKVKELVPIINIDGPRYPVLGGLWQPRGGTARHDAVAWGYARACAGMGMDIIQNCAVQGVETEGGQVKAVNTTKGRIECGKLALVVAGLLVLAGTLADLVATTLAGSLSAGWTTRRLSPMGWAAIRRVGAGRHRLLQGAGLLLVLGLVLLRILGLWIGWTLVLWDTAGWTTSQDRAASAWNGCTPPATPSRRSGWATSFPRRHWVGC